MKKIGTSNRMLQIEKVIGTPSAQKVIVLLVIWPSLTIKELTEKTKLSKSQIHATIKNLQEIELATMRTRGQYTLATNKFANLLKEAYQEKILEAINKQIYEIKQTIKKDDVERATEMYKELKDNYEPLLNESFPFILSSLSQRFIEAYK